MDEQQIIDALYLRVYLYAAEKKLETTLTVLPAVREQLTASDTATEDRFNAPTRLLPLQHCLAVARILMGLNLPLERDEEDLVLASAICHVLPEREKYTREMAAVRAGLDPHVFEIVGLVTGWQGMPPLVKAEVSRLLEADPLAILVLLADRGDRVGQLYGASPWKVHQYINETREFVFPLCVYAEEHYPEVYGAANILMEKMRNLIEINEILLSRYESVEASLIHEIQTLREDNARIRGIIHRLEEENKAI